MVKKKLCLKCRQGPNWWGHKYKRLIFGLRLTISIKGSSAQDMCDVAAINRRWATWHVHPFQEVFATGGPLSSHARRLPHSVLRSCQVLCVQLAKGACDVMFIPGSGKGRGEEAPP